MEVTRVSLLQRTNHVPRRDRLLLALALAAAGVVVATWAVLGRRSRDRRDAVLAAQRPLLEEAQRKARAAGIEPSASDGSSDDLKVIEGVGPRAEAALAAAGIRRYGDLAAVRPGRLRKILRAGGGRMSDPRTWPQQAGLAAAGDWDQLAALQRELSRGRRRGAA
jgi:predicted flap endonuclease-1-like 5' DNA nuclease